MIDDDDRMRLALQAAAVGSFVWHPDEDRGEPDEQMLALFGLPSDGRPTLADAFVRVLHPDDRQRYLAAVAEAVDPAGDGRFHEEFRIVPPEGGERWLALTARTEFAGSPRRALRMAGVVLDVTDRRRADALRRREASRVRLVGAVAPIADPVAVQRAVLRLLREDLGLSGAVYSEIAGDDAIVHVDDVDGSPLTGRHAIGDLGPSMLREAAAAGRLLVVDDLADAGLTPEQAERYRAVGVGAFVAAPLVKDGTLTAVLAAFHAARHRWTPDEVAVVEEAAGLTWAAVERARAEETARRSDERFRLVCESAPLMISLARADGSIEYINPRWTAFSGRSEQAFIDGDWSDAIHPDDQALIIAQWDAARASGESYAYEFRARDAGGEYRWLRAHGVPVPGSGSVGGDEVRWINVAVDIHDRRTAEELLRRESSRSALLAKVLTAVETADGLADAARSVVDLIVPEAADSASVDIVDDDGTRRTIAAREAGGGHVTAWPMGRGRAPQLTVGLDPAHRPSAEEDRAFLADLSARVGVVLENARLREEEHRIATVLQAALLPARPTSGLDVAIAARYRAASGLVRVGGDWYDTLHLPDGSVGVCVGDVVDHGVHAAAAMGRIRVALGVMARDAGAPSEVLARLDDFMSTPDGVDFATVCYAVHDPATSTLRYACAGHPPPLLVTPDGTARWLDGGRSAPLLAGQRPVRPQATEVVEDGSLVLLYSDGLVERRGESLDRGLERLASAAVAGCDLDVEDVCDHVIEALGVQRDRDDDVVVLALRTLSAAGGRAPARAPARPATA